MTDEPTGRRLAEAFVAGDTAAVLGLLADDATFHSPVADYAGRERFAPVLGALAEVIAGGAITSVVDGEGQTVAFFAGEVEGRAADGVLRVVAPPGGPATELTLMVRPLASLLAGVERMKALLS